MEAGAAHFVTLDNGHIEPCCSAVQRCGIATRTTANDHQIEVLSRRNHPLQKSCSTAGVLWISTSDPTKGTALCWAFFTLRRRPCAGRLSHPWHVTILCSEQCFLTTILRGCEQRGQGRFVACVCEASRLPTSTVSGVLWQVPEVRVAARAVLRVVALHAGIVPRATFGRR